MVNGWIDVKENIMPQRPVLSTTSIVPQLAPVKTKRSLANVIPGSRLVKKTKIADANICWLKNAQSEIYRLRRLRISCFRRRNGRKGPPVATDPFKMRQVLGVCFDGVIIE
jgi:hypothetical protein